MAYRASRDRGLQHIYTTTRFLAVGALAAGGVLSAAVAKALPGKSASPATSVPAASIATSRHQPGRDDYSGGESPTTSAPALNPPVEVPRSVTAPPVVSSGGS